MPQKLNIQMGNWRLRRALNGHGKLLALDTATQPLAVGCKQMSAKLKAADRALDDATEEEAGFEIVALYCDDGADLATKKLADDLYNACGRRRDDPRYVKAFPKGAAEVTQPRLWQQLEVLDEYMSAWSKIAESDTVVKDALPRIQEHREKLRTALADYEAAGKRRAAAEWDEKNARMSAVALWDSDLGELYRLFPGDRSRVASFFPAVRTRSNQADAETDGQGSNELEAPAATDNG